MGDEMGVNGMDNDAEKAVKWAGDEDFCVLIGRSCAQRFVFAQTQSEG